MLNLPRVTLACVDCVNHELALAAIGQCLQKCVFARVLFVTDREFDIPDIEVIRIPPLASRAAYSQFVIKELLAHVTTDFVLLMQWDGFVINAAAWDDAFLDYDYVGARWGWITDGHAVGNGGFCLRSRRLLEALADPHIAEFPIEDVAVCRTYRDYLESRHGIRYAPDALADRFAFEATYPQGLPFGFHGLFNFWLFFRKQDLEAFLGMATPAILGSLQCIQLAKNLGDLKRDDEALLVAQRILDAHPAHREAAALCASIGGGRAQAATPTNVSSQAVSASTNTAARVGRNDPCPCGSGKRYKACHGGLA